PFVYKLNHASNKSQLPSTVTRFQPFRTSSHNMNPTTPVLNGRSGPFRKILPKPPQTGTTSPALKKKPGRPKKEKPSHPMADPTLPSGSKRKRGRPSTADAEPPAPKKARGRPPKAVAGPSQDSSQDTSAFQVLQGNSTLPSPPESAPAPQPLPSEGSRDYVRLCDLENGLALQPAKSRARSVVKSNSVDSDTGRASSTKSTWEIAMKEREDHLRSLPEGIFECAPLSPQLAGSWEVQSVGDPAEEEETSRYFPPGYMIATDLSVDEVPDSFTAIFEDIFEDYKV
ncbi:hypothetical protein P153DRAFT_405749, partial [Dothidotthia symphoricarpi CBS 119687]